MAQRRDGGRRGAIGVGPWLRISCWTLLRAASPRASWRNQRIDNIRILPLDTLEEKIKMVQNGLNKFTREVIFKNIQPQGDKEWSQEAQTHRICGCRKKFF